MNGRITLPSLRALLVKLRGFINTYVLKYTHVLPRDPAHAHSTALAASTVKHQQEALGTSEEEMSIRICKGSGDPSEERTLNCKIFLCGHYGAPSFLLGNAS